MSDESPLKPITLSIAAVERDTRIAKDTLRVWERRYGFPVPLRDAGGERAYPLDQVEKLRLVKRLMDAGHRPGRIVKMSMGELAQLSDVASASGQVPASMPADGAAPADLRHFLEVLKTHDSRALRRALSQALMRMGMSRFIIEVAAPLTTMVGDDWMRGQLQVFEEHLYSDVLHTVLRTALTTTAEPDSNARPRVLLTTFPQEPHGLGLLMAEVLFSLEGCRCMNLGPQTPLWDIALAAKAQQSHIVALSFTSVPNPNQVLEGLQELRAKLPASVEIWAGGTAPVLHRRAVDGVLSVSSLEEIGPQIQRWRTMAD